MRYLYFVYLLKHHYTDILFDKSEVVYGNNLQHCNYIINGIIGSQMQLSKVKMFTITD